MSGASRTLTTDRSRTVEELYGLVTCPTCSLRLRATWWTGFGDDIEVSKVCDECGMYFTARMSLVVEEPPMGAE